MNPYPDIRQLFMLAQEIEIIGQGAFRELARKAADAKAASLFRELEEEEAKHEKYFCNLRESTSGTAPAMPCMDADLRRRLDQIPAASARPDPAGSLRMFRGNESEEELLRVALEFEQTTAVFFQHLSGCLQPGQDRATFDAIIAEELNHVAALEARLSALRSSAS